MALAWGLCLLSPYSRDMGSAASTSAPAPPPRKEEEDEEVVEPADVEMNTVGPNMGPAPASTQATVGGRRRSRSKKSKKSKKSRKSKKSKKSQSSRKQ